MVDSSAALRAASSRAAAEDLAGHALIGPPLLWSEVLSAIHEAVWRDEIDKAQAARVRGRFGALGIRRVRPDELYETAWELANELGLAKTYDAEFLALARLRDTQVLTTDARLRQGAERTGLVIDPTDL